MDYILYSLLGLANGMAWGISAPEHWSGVRTTIAALSTYVAICVVIRLVA